MSSEFAGKVMTLDEATRKFVDDGMTVYFGGFGQHTPFAAVHEIIRQRKRNLTITRAAGGVIFDQLIGAGCVKKIITSHVWNFVGPTPTYAFKRAAEEGRPKIEIEEDTLFSLNMRYLAGTLGLPFVPIKSVMGTAIFERGRKKHYRTMICPFTGEQLCLVRAINPDLGVLQVQRVDRDGNAQVWSVRGDSKHGINACERVIICAEEIVDTEVIKADPDRTVIPGFRVDAVVEEPWGSHPDFMQGYYDRDLEYYHMYGSETRTLEGFEKFLENWVYSVNDRKEYLEKLGVKKMMKLRARHALSGPVNFGYR
jgi:glutaconate CoA-transferase subunit A